MAKPCTLCAVAVFFPIVALCVWLSMRPLDYYVLVRGMHVYMRRFEIDLWQVRCDAYTIKSHTCERNNKQSNQTKEFNDHKTYRGEHVQTNHLARECMCKCMWSVRRYMRRARAFASSKV